MSVANYSYINAKIRALKADILTTELWDALLGARDMLAAIRILDATGYSELVKDFDETTSPNVIERALQNDFNRILTEINNDIPSSGQTLMLWITRKFQKEVIKTLLRLFTTSADQTTAERLLIPIDPFTSENLLDLLNVKNLQELISELPDSFFANLIEQSLPQYQETNDLVIIERMIDNTILQNLFTTTRQQSGLDQEITSQLVGVEIDLVNLLITLRTQPLGIPAVKAEELLLDVDYRLPRSICRMAMQGRSFEERVNQLENSFYKDLISKSWEAYEQYQSLYTFEHIFYQQIRADSLNALLGFPFHFGTILGYLNLKWYETLNLKALMNGKADELDPNIIKRTLIL